MCGKTALVDHLASLVRWLIVWRCWEQGFLDARVGGKTVDTFVHFIDRLNQEPEIKCNPGCS